MHWMSNGISYKEYLSTHSSLTYTNVGTSMMPLLRQGRDLFTVVPKGDERCKVGDVVLYHRPPKSYVLHRVVEVLPDGYIILGDNCVNRERVSEEDVFGVMTSFVRNGKEHDINETSYRLYSRTMLVTERPRVAARKLCAKAWHTLKGARRD